MMNHKIIYPILLLALLAVGCAKQGFPSGGPSDKTPPLVLSTTPANASLGFAQKGFFIAFDEYVVIKDADNNILVSPPMKTKPTYTPKGRGIQVDIKDTLLPNTTYLFQFKNAIADFNEGNLLPSFEYVFSTGTALDSMYLEGRVLDALTAQPRKDPVTVMLYPAPSDDSVVAHSNPLYITRCDDHGAFTFNHIQPGVYRILALEDGDKNLRLGAGEPVAFSDTLWAAHPTPVKSADTVAQDTSHRRPVAKVLPTLLISEYTVQSQRVTSSDFKAKGRAQVTTLNPMLAPTIEPLCDSLHWRLNPKGDTLTLWTIAPNIDSLQFVLSDASGISDTLKLRYRAPKKAAVASAVTKPSNATFSVGPKMAYFDTIRILFANPTAISDPESSVQVLNLADSSIVLCPFSLSSDDMSARLLFDVKPGSRYQVVVPKGFFTDIYGQRSDSLSLSTEVSTPSQYGTLALNLTTSLPEPRLLVQLLDDKDNVLRLQQVEANKATIRFEHLKSGKYRVRAIWDANANEQWDAGDYWQHRQPERVFYFEKTMDVRENWDFEENWAIE